VPTETDALARLEERDIGTDGIDHAGYFMAGYARIFEAGPLAPGDGDCVTVANTAGLNADAHLAGTGLGELFFYKLKSAASGGELNGTTCDCGHRGNSPVDWRDDRGWRQDAQTR
jgi:hypothetical protein